MRNEIGVGLLLAVSIGLFAWMAVRVGALDAPGETLTATARLDDAAGLMAGAVVSIAGVQVGRVDRLEVDFDKARLTLAIQKTAGVRDDVSLRLRARSVLGEKYIELVPHDPAAPLMADGAVIRDSQGSFEIDEMVSRFEPVLDAIDPAALQRLSASLSAAIEEDPDRPARMLRDAETALHNLAVASAELPSLISESRQTLAQIRSVAAEARPVIDEAERTLAAAGGRIEAVDPARLRSLVEKADLTVAEAQQLVTHLNSQSGRIEHVLANLEEIDKWELRRLLREEGILLRLRPGEVVEADPSSAGTTRP